MSVHAVWVETEHLASRRSAAGVAVCTPLCVRVCGIVVYACVIVVCQCVCVRVCASS